MDSRSVLLMIVYGLFLFNYFLIRQGVLRKLKCSQNSVAMGKIYFLAYLFVLNLFSTSNSMNFLHYQSISFQVAMICTVGMIFVTEKTNKRFWQTSVLMFNRITSVIFLISVFALLFTTVKTLIISKVIIFNSALLLLFILSIGLATTELWLNSVWSKKISKKGV